MTVPTTRVIKLGGSLLDWELLSDRFHEWLSQNQAERTVVVVGGGRLVDDYRNEKLNTPHDEIAAHWHCIGLMSETARAASQLLAIQVAISIDQIPDSGAVILDVSRWMESEYARSNVPCSWQATSDSIATILAADLQASELALMKSTAPAGQTEMRLSDIPGGLVDEHFPVAAREYVTHENARHEPTKRPIRLVNLRSAEFVELAIVLE